MKLSFTLLLAATFLATFGFANNIPQVQHVIIVVQENRTPTNLFHDDSTLIANGAHIVTTLQVDDKCGNKKGFSMQPTGLYTCWDTGHNRLPDWANMWDNGAMDGACNITVGLQQGCPDKSCKDNKTCPYTYVANVAPGVLGPYFQIANQFGYANFMFQTSQGPSFPAHQFLFSGTSAPVRYLDPNNNCTGPFPNEKCWQWFNAENPIKGKEAAGCGGASDNLANLIDLNSVENQYYTPPSPVNVEGFPCYTHDSLPTLLDQAGVSWRYYLRETYNGYGIWTGPADIYDICVDPNQTWHGSCNNAEYLNHVQSVLPGGANYPNDFAPVLTDIESCNLPQVSWVIPDGNWSDHAAWGSAPGDGGPSWVATIVNAVGQDKTCEGGKGYWSDTVILVTWDDWGGYYDDVAPPDCQTAPCTGYSNRTGQQYVYGFRVPLLVVGAYAKLGYISGANAFPPDCAHNTYCHDFGSILNFIEYVFGTGGNPLGGLNGIGNPKYPYADVLVMDKGPAATPYSLFDFFDFTTSHTFIPITPGKYLEDCFHHPGKSGCFPHYPADPDNDENELD